MIQGEGGASFALEPFESLTVGGQFVRQEFQRDVAVEIHVFGFIDHTHAAATQLLQDAVGARWFAQSRLAEPC